MESTTATARSTGRPRSFWVDPRFAIGIGLVVVSVLGVLALVGAADSGVRAYAARDTLTPGDSIHEGDLVERDVRLGGLDGKYLTSGEVPDAGLVVTRPVSAGELVPASAVGSATGLRVAPVVVPVRGRLAHSIVAGAIVDVWSSSETEDGVFGPPSVLVSGATVVRLVEPEGIAAQDGDSVEVLVPRTAIARVLEAIANETSISLVPAGIPAKDRS
ncbi:MAG TPA: SAF domain-containing protein [Lacisediminihabitans sp.]|uniref:SAF domain-containing protein n=1 Tax=Lacisediminihabitans sp. TaxID=2787631 RepID=UPI002EDB7A10